jgi:hypothetical protein
MGDDKRITHIQFEDWSIGDIYLLLLDRFGIDHDVRESRSVSIEFNLLTKKGSIYIVAKDETLPSQNKGPISDTQK